MKHKIYSRLSFLFVAFLLTQGVCFPVEGAEKPRAKFDLTAWKELPVMYAGRVMPLDAFARMQLRPKGLKFSLDGVETDKTFTAEQLRMLEERTGMSATVKRRYEPAEMLFSWLVEPEVWEYVPFLLAEKEDLRVLMGLPIRGADGARLGHVSPYELQKFYASREYAEFVAEVERMRKEDPDKEFPPEKKVLTEELLRLQAEYGNFQELSYNPQRPGVERGLFEARFVEVLRMWRQPALSQGGENAALPGVEQGINGRVTELVNGIYQEIMKESRGERASPEVLTAQCKLLADAAAQLAEGVRRRADTLFEKAEKTPGGVSDAVLRGEQTLRFMTQQFAVQTRELLFTFYENGNTLYVVPALDAAALDARRNDKVKTHPWLSLNALLYGQADGALAGMPEVYVRRVREAFRKAEQGWLAEDAEAFRAGMETFSAEMRKLAAEVEPQREKLLPEERRDAEVLAATAYPGPEKLQLEVYYYRLGPFWRGCLLPFIGMLFFGVCGILGFVTGGDAAGARTLNNIRGVCFWAGFLFLALGVFMIAYGLALRAWIMGRAPVTNMFETVVFVALTAGVMGMWFTLRPALDSLLHRGWKASAFPWTKSAAGVRVLAWGMLVPRLAVMAMIVWIFTLRGYGLGEGYNAIHLVPQAAIGAAVPALSELVMWLAGILTLTVLAWWVPRLCVAPLAACVIVLGTFSKGGRKETLPADNRSATENTASGAGISTHMKILNRCWFAFSTALAVCVIAMIPFLAPDKITPDLRNLMPILRDNYWLSVHVMVIVGSYGAGMLAWAFANLSLLVYLFGNYRVVHHAGGRRTYSPPEICRTLSDLMYRSIQAATLMLVIGTILGGLWADVSWGRFWSWDRKEVWALITLFIYLAILHGRYVRLLGEFTLAVGSVIGALAIIMAWYGVNFVLGSSLHGYGSGTGGTWFFVVAALANIALILAAALRYTVCTHEEKLSTGKLPNFK